MTAHPVAAEDGASRPPLLRMRGVSKRYPGVVANEDIDLDVHAGEIVALLGENGAGKSTLMKVLFGLERPDAGTIELDGRPVSFSGPRDALRHRIGMVHQHFMLVDDMTVTENVALGDARGLRPDARSTAASILEISTQFGLELDPDAVVGDLPVATQQRVEIVKLLHRGARLLILDEPTASVGPVDWERLGRILRRLADDGAGVIFISHKLDEVRGVADRAVVLRDGRMAGSVRPAEVTKEEVARLMVGRDVELRVEKPPAVVGDTVLELTGVSVGSDVRRLLDDVRLEVRAGEVLGIAGVEGNGQQELIEVITGARSPDDGAVVIDGRTLDGGVAAFIEAGGAHVPEDRHHDAVALELSVADNLLLRDHARAPYSRRGILDRRRSAGLVDELVRDYDVRCSTPEATMSQLSGGNQQKAVLGRELHGGPRLLVVAQPTRGLDVGAMEFVYQHILYHRARGGATVLVSSDLEEIMSLSDRVAVLSRGRVLAQLEADALTTERLGLLMAGVADDAAPTVPGGSSR